MNAGWECPHETDDGIADQFSSCHCPDDSLLALTTAVTYSGIRANLMRSEREMISRDFRRLALVPGQDPQGVLVKTHGPPQHCYFVNREELIIDLEVQDSSSFLGS